MTPDLVGRPFEEAEAIAKTAGLSVKTEMTRPERDFFPVDERCLYVVRQRQLADETILLTLAARLRKEVS